MVSQKTLIKKDPYQTSRILYIIEAALEYFVAILVGETYLAKIAMSIGVSDSGIGVLTAFVSLGQFFQIFTIFISQRKGVKKLIVWLGLANQLLFSLLYVVPIFPSTFKLTIPIFVVALLLAQIIFNFSIPGKTHWYMSLVPNNKRGIFTANKEIISLISGMIFSMGMGRLIDHFEDKGELKSAFILIAITLLTLTLLHTLTLLFSKEKPKPEGVKTPSVRETISALFRNKTLYRVIGLSAIWYAVRYTYTPFMGTYKLGVLGFSMTFSTIIGAVASIMRAVFSRSMGRFADKYSFKKLLILCYGIEIVALAFAVFSVPSNGKVFFSIYSILAGIAMAGLNSSEINLIYSYVEESQRIGALAIKNMVSGFIGFFTTLLMTIPVNYIQNNGNRIFGIQIYAQQFTTFIGLIGVIIVALYAIFVLKDKKVESNNPPTQES